MNNKNNFNINQINGNITSNDNSNMFINSPQQKNIENKVTVYKKIQYPTRQSKEEREKLQKITQRPALMFNVGKPITCFGLVAGKHRNGLYTVINVVDKHGKYVADHIHLDFKEDEYNYKGIDPLLDRFIRFTGMVSTYKKGENDDYCISILDKIDIRASSLYYIGEPIDYEVLETFPDKINEFLRTCNITAIYNIIDEIRNRINILTEDVACSDFVYYFIINQYFLNTATYSIYDGELRDQGFNECCILDLLILLSVSLYDLKTHKSIDLYTLFHKIVCYCNIIQGINKFYKYINGFESILPYDYNPGFVRFCKKLGYEGKRKFNSLWANALLRRKSFDMYEPVPKDLTREILVERMHHVILEIIQ